MVRRTGDYRTRRGQCTEPVSLQDLFPFTITHKYIHQADFVVRVLIHLRLDLQQWDEEKEMEVQLKVR